MTRADKSITYREFEIKMDSRAVFVKGQNVTLTRMEFDVLYFLASNPNICDIK